MLELELAAQMGELEENLAIETPEATETNPPIGGTNKADIIIHAGK